MMRARTRQPGMAADPIKRGETLLRLSGLSVTYAQRRSSTRAVRGLSLEVAAGQIVGIAGESGCGKTASGLAVMGLLPPTARIEGSIEYRGSELIGLPEKRLRQIRGSEIAMVFQETVGALNPVYRIGDQINMAIRAHRGGSKAEWTAQARRALEDVRLTDPDRVLHSYPYELSGGMCQRVMIAMALACGSKVLIADEPTTAIDVSVQHEILELLKRIVSERSIGVIMISHDLGVLAELCDDLVIMYRGEAVETGRAPDVLYESAHPYTRALLACQPQLYGERVVLPNLPMSQRDASTEETGCAFRQRCPMRADACAEHPELLPLAPPGEQRASRCWRSGEIAEMWPALPWAGEATLSGDGLTVSHAE
jgi:oligopeptide/dipeptide ABC transporter ATP-binding protein